MRPGQNQNQNQSQSRNQRRAEPGPSHLENKEVKQQQQRAAEPRSHSGSIQPNRTEPDRTEPRLGSEPGRSGLSGLTWSCRSGEEAQLVLSMAAAPLQLRCVMTTPRRVITLDQQNQHQNQDRQGAEPGARARCEVQLDSGLKVKNSSSR